MDDASAAELRRLRARAYGPDADLLEDPAASSRLMELEAQLRAEREAERPPVATASSASGTGREPGPAAEARCRSGLGKAKLRSGGQEEDPFRLPCDPPRLDETGDVCELQGRNTT